MIPWNRSQHKIYALALAILGTFSSEAFTMEASMKDQKNYPSGVLYFSTGESIKKLDLKTREQQEIVPGRDREGRNKSNSIFPVYYSKENKMYFFRSYVWPVKRQLVTFDLENQKEQEVQGLDHYIKALSLS